MKMVVLICLSVAVSALVSGSVMAADEIPDLPPLPPLAETHSGFIPAGWVETALVEADLNGDQRNDVAMVISRPVRPADDFNSNRKEHVLVIALRQDDGSLKRSAVSDQAVLGDFDGGVLGFPFREMRFERGAVVIEHYGGSRNRWEITSRYRYQNGRWILIGRTDEDTDIHYPDFFDKVDFNLSTGLVIRNSRSGGLGDDDLQAAQRALLKHPEVRYWCLPVPVMRKAPPTDGTPATPDWGFHSLDLNRKEQVIGNSAGWKGPGDLSATLRAVAAPDGLFLRAEVTDDEVTEVDQVRLTNEQGVEIKPNIETRTATPTGYVMVLSWSKAQLLATLGEDHADWLDPGYKEDNDATGIGELPVAIEIHDEDGGEMGGTLSTRPSDAPYAAGISIYALSTLVLEDQ